MIKSSEIEVQELTSIESVLDFGSSDGSTNCNDYSDWSFEGKNNYLLH